MQSSYSTSLTSNFDRISPLLNPLQYPPDCGHPRLFTELGNNVSMYNQYSSTDRDNLLASSGAFVVPPPKSAMVFPVRTSDRKTIATKYDPLWFGSMISKTEYKNITKGLDSMVSEYNGEKIGKRDLAQETNAAVDTSVKSSWTSIKVTCIVFCCCAVFFLPIAIPLCSCGDTMGIPMLMFGIFCLICGIATGITFMGVDVWYNNPIAFCNQIQLKAVEYNQQLMPRGLYVMVYHYCYLSKSLYHYDSFKLFYIFVKIPPQPSPIKLKRNAKSLLDLPKELVETAKKGAQLLTAIHLPVAEALLYVSPEAVIANAQRVHCFESICSAMESPQHTTSAPVAMASLPLTGPAPPPIVQASMPPSQIIPPTDGESIYVDDEPEAPEVPVMNYQYQPPVGSQGPYFQNTQDDMFEYTPLL
eukprot:gnl/Carplike_NY0171/3692_a4980_285.p1 GENE.gnl/Carplike_NY0171/3692_a4980_285~~gnl/Carplike_NY0171/3692_a4980_285.p1  ORF type:complete len:416 (+),score=59.68 gnl/Carplike_NY0171/3692_a4980_285:15-1262(+)